MLIEADKFHPSLEIGAYSFASFEEWQSWRQRNPWFGFQSAPKEIADHCVDSGITSRWFGYIPPSNVTCRTPNYRESLCGNGFNPRQRAILETLLVLTKGWEQDVRIYAAEAITPFARELKARYPNFVGSEYAPSAEDQAQIAPVEHQDLASLTYPNERFDICITNEVFEHLTDLRASIAELKRVLSPGGILLSTFPFFHNRRDSLIKASLNGLGDVEYVMEAEYHGNPMDSNRGSLVFQIPGWDILNIVQDAGFKHSGFLLMTSKKAGFTSRDYPGIMVLMAPN
jgi:SAM-dependent methyltransferase